MTPVNHRRRLILFLVFTVSPLLLAQEQLDYPSANLSARWVNNPSQIQHNVSFEDGSQVRSILLRRSPLFYGPTYACGFYCNAACDAFLFAIFAVYANSGGLITNPTTAPPQVVWSANRAAPVGADATLHLTDLGDLVLAHANGTVVWSTGTASKSVAGMNISQSGNLVLFDQSGAPVWQSFEHPTDTLVLGQTLQEGQNLDANVSITNWSKGPVYLTVLSDGLYAFTASTPPQNYYQYTLNGNKSAKTPSYVKYTNGSLDLFTLFATPGTPDIRISLPPASSSVQFMRFESDGHLRIFEWNQGWQVTADVLGLDVCAYPMVCGQYGICFNGQCSCPAGGSASSSYFKPVDGRRISLGCSLVTPLSCQSLQDHHLLAVDDVSYFTFRYSGAAAFENIDEASCKQACLKNCSCKAALFQYGGDVSNGDCFLPTQLFSLQNNQPSLTHFNSSAYIKVEAASNASNNSIVPNSLSQNKGSSRVGLIIGIIVGIVAFVLGGLRLMYVRRRRRTTEVEEDDFPIVPGMPTRFSFHHLKEATNNFSKKLGQGGFGSVFEGNIGDQKVAVKRLDGVGQGKREFLAEVVTIGSIHHINLVKLIGFCADKSNRLLVYEYMSNGSLDKWIFSKDQNHTLDWQTICKIITDIAKGLSYIHEECRQRIAHLDIKPQNILLDDKFNAKVSDFGLAKLIDRDQEQVMTRMRGTRGYLAPEWLTSVITEKVDVYSFGVVVVEIVCGRKNLDYSQPEESIHLISLLQETIKMNKLEEIVSHDNDMKLHLEEAIKMIKLAVWCLQVDSSKRPSMSTVVKVLQGAATIETDLDYDIVTTAHLMRKQRDNYLLDTSSTPSASLLSGWHQTSNGQPMAMTPVNHRRRLVLFLLFTVSPLLLAQMQVDFPSANLSTLWVNDPSLHNDSFEDGSLVRSILLRSFPNDGGPTYACGFYCNNPCNVFLFAIFAVFTDSVGYIMGFTTSPPRVVWSANRATPVEDNSTLHLTDLGDLVLAHANGTVVWSTGTASRSVAGMNISLSGNLVLFDQSGAPVWQSFEHPTDTLVRGQTLKEGQKLDANVSVTNWTNGPVYLTVLSDGLYAFTASTPPQCYYQKTPDDNKHINGSLDLFALFALPASSSVQFMRFESDGHLRVYELNLEWNVTADVLGLDVCAYPMVCGEYGICSNGQCSCPVRESGSSSYFKPIDDRRINLGCSLVTPLSCESLQDHHLLTVDNVSYFSFTDSGAAAFKNIDEASCKQACLKNCSCKAALFQYAENVSDGNCFLPTQLFSLQNNQPSLTHFNSSAYIKVETASTASNNSIVPSPPSENKGSTRVPFIIGIIVAAIVVFVLAIGGLLSVYVRRRKTTEVEEDDFPIVPGMPTRFSFQHLKEATNDFSKKLGQGGFGSVFEGSIGDQKVAVKRLDGVGQGKREFLAEVETIGSIHHINLVKLIGFCADKSNRLLVYEYMSNGSLDNWIFSKDQNHTLDWQTICKIITDIAKGLSYIHEECRQRIAHLDIKPQNILLDVKFNAKVSDFGLAKLIDRDQEQVMTRMRGTRGYLAPEWLTSVITEKVDVYSFGVVVVEIVCGRKNLDYSQPEESIHLISLLQETIKMNKLEEIVSHDNDMKLHLEEAIKMIKLAVWCLQIDCSKRPSMSTVVKVLQGAATIETDLDYDIVTTAHLMRKQRDNYLLDASSTPSASLLSGPR
ncbi:hypothetical protein ZIOFF_048810 [Zingiber officinale]|uniref:non-specific serine/threonine protein kinase n=2 Tax=Zingiber officinale TaxID=94328 RepID=A0A8J5FX63_ZINOF|nr:hypothetical protein ZIOFF_048810 [Zingiber officinale]